MRSKIHEFQERLRGLTLSHGTKPEYVQKILLEGLTGEYVYSCVDEGWPMHDPTAFIVFPGEAVWDRTYPDPEGQWGWMGENHSMAKYVQEHGLEETLDELERYFNNVTDGGFDDMTDPYNYNLVTIGSVGPELIRS